MKLDKKNATFCIKSKYHITGMGQCHWLI